MMFNTLQTYSLSVLKFAISFAAHVMHVLYLYCTTYTDCFFYAPMVRKDCMPCHDKAKYVLFWWYLERNAHQDT